MNNSADGRCPLTQLVSRRGNKWQLMTKSRLRDATEPTVFVPEVARQRDVLLARLISVYLQALAPVSDWIK